MMPPFLAQAYAWYCCCRPHDDASGTPRPPPGGAPQMFMSSHLPAAQVEGGAQGGFWRPYVVKGPPEMQKTSGAPVALARTAPLVHLRLEYVSNTEAAVLSWSVWGVTALLLAGVIGT